MDGHPRGASQGTEPRLQAGSPSPPALSRANEVDSGLQGGQSMRGPPRKARSGHPCHRCGGLFTDRTARWAATGQHNLMHPSPNEGVDDITRQRLASRANAGSGSHDFPRDRLHLPQPLVGVGYFWRRAVGVQAHHALTQIRFSFAACVPVSGHGGGSWSWRSDICRGPDIRDLGPDPVPYSVVKERAQSARAQGVGRNGFVSRTTTFGYSSCHISLVWRRRSSSAARLNSRQAAVLGRSSWLVVAFSIRLAMAAWNRLRRSSAVSSQ